MNNSPYDFIIDDLVACISVLFLIFLSNEVSLYVPNFIVYCWNSWDLKFIPFFFSLYFYIRFRKCSKNKGGGMYFLSFECAQDIKTANLGTGILSYTTNTYVGNILIRDCSFVLLADLISLESSRIFFSLYSTREYALALIVITNR